MLKLFKIIRSLILIRKYLKEGGKEKMKPGIKTTEFWVTILVVVLPVINSLLKIDLEVEGTARAIVQIIEGVGSVVAAITYIISRTSLKKSVEK